MLTSNIEEVESGFSEMFQGSREWVSFSFLTLVATYGIIPAVLMGLGHSVPPILLVEDGLYEMIGAVACILASAFLVFAFLQTKPKNLWLILFAIGTLVLALEELSWGQRLLGISLPQEIKEVNFQGELNLHNSKLLQSVNGDVSLLLRISYLLYFVAFPFVLIIFPSLQRFINPLRLPIPSNPVAMAVLVSQLVHTTNVSVLVNAGVSIFSSRIGEAHESNLQIILLFFALEIWWFSRKPKETLSK
jgi:hypothetical protein